MVYMYHSFLIHLSADGHLGCFHVLALNRKYLVSHNFLQPGIQDQLNLEILTEGLSFRGSEDIGCGYSHLKV